MQFRSPIRQPRFFCEVHPYCNVNVLISLVSWRSYLTVNTRMKTVPTLLSVYHIITGVIIALPREAIVTMDVRSFPTIIVPKISPWPGSSSTSCQRWTMIICRNGMINAL